MGYASYEPDSTGSAPGRFTQHAVDGDTLHHWTFDGDDTDQVGILDQDGTSLLCYCPVFGQLEGDTRQALASQETVLYEVGSAASLKTLTEMTVACWVCMTETPAQVMSIVGFRVPGAGSGDPNTFNFAWNIDYDNLGELRFAWQSGNKLTWIATAGLAALDLNRWYHISATRNAAQDTARIYINGVKRGEVTGASPFDGGGSVSTLNFMQNGSSIGAIGTVATIIIKDVEINDAQAAALYQSTLV